MVAGLERHRCRHRVRSRAACLADARPVTQRGGVLVSGLSPSSREPCGLRLEHDAEVLEPGGGPGARGIARIVGGSSRCVAIPAGRQAARRHSRALFAVGPHPRAAGRAGAGRRLARNRSDRRTAPSSPTPRSASISQRNRRQPGEVHLGVHCRAVPGWGQPGAQRRRGGWRRQRRSPRVHGLFSSLTRTGCRVPGGSITLDAPRGRLRDRPWSGAA
jgi:hypothetical protein